MSGIDANEMQDLVEKVEAIKKTLESEGKKGQTRLKNINEVPQQIPHTKEGKFDSKEWGVLDNESQRKLHHELSRVLEALNAAAGTPEKAAPNKDAAQPAKQAAGTAEKAATKASAPAAGPGAAMPQKQPWGYRAALTATSILLPAAATVLTVIIVLVKWPAPYFPAPVWGTLGAFAAWLVFSGFYREAADAQHAIPSSYGELGPRLDELEAGLEGFCPAAGSPNNPCTNTAYYEAVKENGEIRKDLAMKGFTWLLATGYSKVWGRLYRAEEALIEFAPQKKVLKGAYYDEARLEGSDIPNRDDLLAKLRKAVVSIDPSAHKYLKSTAAVTVPPALAIGTTALPGGTVAVDYCAALLPIGGVPPYKWAVIGGAPPEGLVLSAAGVLRGTPTSDGHGNFTVQVTDRAGVAVEKYFDLLISPQTPATQLPLAFSTTTPLPWGTVDVEYAETLFATGGKPPYKWKAIDEGTIPGMHLSNEGVLSGRPVRDIEFEAEVADSSGTSPIKRKFTLFIKPSGTSAAAPVGGIEPELNARGVLSDVRRSVNEYRNARWNGLILARNRLLATFTLTTMVVFALLAIAIMSGAKSTNIIAATVFYLVGATVGLCNRLRSESQAESAIPDYGLSAARLITLPLFSGLGAIGGLLFVAYLPFATPVLAPHLSSAQTSTTQNSTGKNPAVKAPAPATGTSEEAPTKAPAPAAGTLEKAAPNKDAAEVAKQPAGPPEKAADKETAETAGTPKKKADQVSKKTAGIGEKDGSKETAQRGDGNTTTRRDEKAPPKIKDIFNLKKNLIGLFVAAVFGLTPGLLFDRLQQQADRYKADLKSSQSSEGTQKS
jgi:hypothetical protein